MAALANISGVVTGLDTNGIIDKMMQIEQVPLTRLQSRNALVNQKLTAWQTLNTRVLAVKTNAEALSTASTFASTSFASSNSDIVSGSTNGSAQPGSYYLTVAQLAQTEQLATQGFADTNTTSIGTGTVTLGGGKISINIDSTNSTLAGLANAINSSGANVRATIINNGSATNPYQLVMTSTKSGTAGQIGLDVSGLTGGTAPVTPVLQAAQDANISLGSGAGAISVTKSSNTIDDLIPGVTLNLKKADASTPVTISISQDTESVKQKIKDFVDQFNNLMQYFNDQSSWNSTTKTSGLLFGDARLQTMQSDFRSIASTLVTGVSGSCSLLSQIGITSDGKDKLQIDDAKLSDALTNRLTDVMKLFAATGEASSAGVQYVIATDKTKPSGAAGYGIEVTQLPSCSRLTAGIAQTGALLQDETLTINGVTIQLTAGMTQDQVLSKINESTAKSGVAASATQADGTGTGSYLTLTQTNAGSARRISMVSTVSNGTADTSGVGSTAATVTSPGGQSGAGTSLAGLNIAGTINGEPATGDGSILIGNQGNANTEELMVRVTGTTIGSYGTVKFSRGIAAAMSDYAASLSDTVDGALKQAQDGLQALIDQNNRSITEMQARLTKKRDQLIIQFTKMESAIGTLQSQGQYLTSQIASLG